MQRFILRRIAESIVCLWVLSVIVFFSARLSGDPLDLLMSEASSTHDRQVMAAKLGMDKPLVAQYGVFLQNAVRGDLGRSIYLQRPVPEVIMSRVPASLQLGALAMLASLMMALPLGVYAAVKRGSLFDFGARMFAVVGQSVPAFWLGLLLILVFAVRLRVLPAGGQSGPTSYILPAFTMAYSVTAGITRLTRSSVLEVLDSDYVKLARVKGLSELSVIWKHSFRNALPTVLTFATMVFVVMIAGAVVTETVFAWPGVGRLVVDAVMWRDFPLVQGVVLLLGSLYVATNLATDILYAYLNPRVRYGR